MTAQEQKALKLALEAAREWIGKAPHGDNCFLHDEGEYNRCFCGKDSIENYIDGVLENIVTPQRKPLTEWQPIETAPKTGRELILLLTPSKWPQIAYSNSWWTTGFSVENKPTHWMPIPPIEAAHGITASEAEDLARSKT